MLNFFTKPRRAFGLDVSGSSVKALQLAHKPGGNFEMTAYTELPLPKGLVNGDVISDLKNMAYVIKDALLKPKFGGFSGRLVVACLPESKSFVRVIQIPRMSEQEAENAIPFEAENFIPLPLDQVYLDYQFLGPVGDKMSVLIIASPRDYVDTFLTVMDYAGLEVAALEVESQSLHRALVSAPASGSELIVDLDVSRSSLIMVEDGNLQFTSSVPIAGNTVTEAIARSLGVSSSKAESIKQEVGIANTTQYPNIKTALVPILNNLSSEIKNILKFYTTHSGRQVNQITLTGGTAKLKNLVEYLAPELSDMPGLQVRLANPYTHVTSGQKFPMDPYEALSFVTAIGLALRGTGDEF